MVAGDWGGVSPLDTSGGGLCWAGGGLCWVGGQAPAGSTLNSGIGIGIEFKPGSRD